MNMPTSRERTWPVRRAQSRWLTVAIRNVAVWPDVEYFQDYDGFEFILLPETTRTPPAVAIELMPPLDLNKARAAIRRFLSAYAWAERHAAEDDFGIGSGYPGGVGKNEGPIQTSGANFRLDYLPSTTDPKARLCLALYREALGLGNTTYRFLAFFKIINVLHENGAKQIAWINAAIPKLADRLALERLDKLCKPQTDLGKYLYESGRCAVAHAYAEPIADPDDPEDTERLNSELPIVQALAEHLIESELGIKSAETIHRDHLYELAGFREHFGPDLIARLKSKSAVKSDELRPLPALIFHVRDHLPRSSFLRMTSTIVSADGGIVIVDCVSSPPLASIRMELDFPAERMRIDPLDGIGLVDDGSANAMAVAMDVHFLFRYIFLNRVVEVWADGADQAWGRTAPYIPLNMRFDGRAWEQEHQEIFRNHLLRLGQEVVKAP
jgi:hypothetical protein